MTSVTYYSVKKITVPSGNGAFLCSPITTVSLYIGCNFIHSPTLNRVHRKFQLS